MSKKVMGLLLSYLSKEYIWLHLCTDQFFRFGFIHLCNSFVLVFHNRVVLHLFSCSSQIKFPPFCLKSIHNSGEFGVPAFNQCVFTILCSCICKLLCNTASPTVKLR